MLPSITESCCTQVDQSRIYDLYIKSGKRQDIEAKLADLKSVYFKLNEQLIKVHQIAQQIIKITKSTKKVSNCREIAQRIADFNYDEVGVDVKGNIEKFYNFFKITSDGFYPTICNYRYLDWFDFTNKTIQVGEVFCRRLVAISLPFAEFFNVYIN